MSGSGAAVTVQDAIAEALAGDATLRAWLVARDDDPRIYEGLAPAGTALTRPDPDDLSPVPRHLPHPYVALTGGREGEFNLLCAPGFEDTLTVQVWVPDTNERLAKQGFGHVRRILSGAALTLTDHVALSCSVGAMRTQPDPDMKAMQAFAPVTVHAMETA